MTIQGRHPTEDLPAFALGALADDERRSVAAHIADCDACQRELAELEAALYEAAALGAVKIDPPRDLRTRVVLRHRGARVVGAGRWQERFLGFLGRPVPLAVPLVIVALLLVSFGVIGATRAQADAYSRALAGVADGRVVALAPQEGNPDARAAVVIPTQGRPYLIVRLPAPPSGKAWEAWVLKQGAGPIAAGTSDAGGVFTLVLAAPYEPGDGVAITLEPFVGSTQPTTAPVLAVAKT